MLALATCQNPRFFWENSIPSLGLSCSRLEDQVWLRAGRRQSHILLWDLLLYFNLSAEVFFVLRWASCLLTQSQFFQSVLLSLLFVLYRQFHGKLLVLDYSRRPLWSSLWSWFFPFQINLSMADQVFWRSFNCCLLPRWSDLRFLIECRRAALRAPFRDLVYLKVGFFNEAHDPFADVEPNLLAVLRSISVRLLRCGPLLGDLSL